MVTQIPDTMIALMIMFIFGTIGGFLGAMALLHITSRRITLRAERKACMNAQEFIRHKNEEEKKR